MDQPEITPNEKFIASALADYMKKNQTQFVDHAMKGLVEQFKEQIKWSGHEVINKTVQEFYSREIMPTVLNHLISNKKIILQGVLDSIDQVCIEIGKAMIKNVQEKLEKQWERTKLFEALFK